MLNGRQILAVVYKDGSDLDYQALYFVPDNMTSQMFADLHAHYEKLGGNDEGPDGPYEDDLKWELGFEEWCLARCGITVEPIEPDAEYDAWTGQAVW